MAISFLIAIQFENRNFINLCLFEFYNKFLFWGYCFCTDTLIDKYVTVVKKKKIFVHKHLPDYQVWNQISGKNKSLKLEV